MIVYRKYDPTTDWKTLESVNLTNKEIVEEVYDVIGEKIKPKHWYERRETFLKRAAEQFNKRKIILQLNGVSVRFQ